MKRLLLAIAALLVAPLPAAARQADGVKAHAVAPAALDPGKAYLLYRASTAKSGLFPITQILVRVPSEAEMTAFRTARAAAYEAALPKLREKAKGGPVPTIEQWSFDDYKGPSNAFGLPSKDFLEDGELRSYLLEVPPGDYVLYGISLNGGSVVTCNCIGTVKFAAKPGVMTFLGALYADKVHKASPVPHLEDNLGEQMFQYGFVFGAGLVPADAQTPVPAPVAALPLALAEFHAVGAFRQPGAAGINRLPPVPGVLGYERGRPIDLRTGRPAE